MKKILGSGCTMFEIEAQKVFYRVSIGNIRHYYLYFHVWNVCFSAVWPFLQGFGRYGVLHSA